MKVQLSTALGFLLASSVANASPAVTGHTITWPDNGWYQVQRSDTFESICEGGDSCIVNPGLYIVINHTTGERFTDILVSEHSNVSSPLVTGSTISWPPNGWYQVQHAQTYETICNGGDECNVTPGEYIVINHTTGQRYENIIVVDEYSNSTISVEGNTISWPDNGWYQVQNSVTYESICNGTLTCTVEDGLYNVINHTTGQRFQNIEVGDLVTPSTLFNGELQSDLLPFLFMTLAGAYLDPLGIQVRSLVSLIETNASDVSILENIDEMISNGEPFVPDTNRILVANFTCPAGGTMQLNRSRQINYLIPGRLVDTSEVYTFSQCRIELSNDEDGLLTGNYELNGEYYYFEDLNFNRRSYSTEHINEFRNLALDLPNGDLLSITANLNETTVGDQMGNPRSASRTVNVGDFQHYNNSAELLSISQSTWYHSENWGNARFGAADTLTLGGGAIVRGDLTQGNTVSLTTESTFERKLFIDPTLGFQSFVGQLTALSSDGSSLISSAIDDIGAAEPNAHVAVLIHDGTHSFSSETPFPELFTPLSEETVNVFNR